MKISNKNRVLPTFSIIKHFRPFTFLIIVAIVAALFVGCYGNNQSQNSTTVTGGNEVSESENNDNVPDEEYTIEWTASLYLADADYMYVVKEDKEMLFKGKGQPMEELPVEQRARFIVEELINSDRTSVPEKTKVLSVDLHGNELIINLSEEFEKDHVGGSTGINMCIGPIVLSLTDIEGVDKVSFKVAGKVLDDFKGHIELNRAFTRDDYINLMQ